MCPCFIAIMLPYGPPYQLFSLLFGAFYVMWGKKDLFMHSLDLMEKCVCYAAFLTPMSPMFLVAHINF